ncbi:MAG: hypothetical protein K6D56_03160 [Clostridia bacterium]|nr:hypothetical protein [Clostridia bacterium]
MNKIKDLIYDKSDILVAILILALAALIIVWRLGIILEYPKEVLGTDDAQTILTNPDDTTQETGEVSGQTGETGEQTQTGENGETGEQTQTGEQTGNQDTQVDEPQATGELWDGDVLSRELKVTIPSEVTTAYGAVQCLVEAGIFESYEEYRTICQENGFDHEKMRSGVFTFPKGATKLDIIKQVNWS